MKWFLPITAATCAAALVAVLSLALPGTSSSTDDPLYGASPVCLGEPSWFAPIHKYYDCNPRITPDFNFASLYSPRLVPSSPRTHRSG